MKLTVVIPAYNEEDAIASTIERARDARAHIAAHSPVSDVEIIVVSDGSTDRTAEIAARYDVHLVEFERNRGYGAAIKKGFETGTGELVGFLDADGTCDPRFFADLCAALVENDADVALGSRMGPQSRMPKLRRVGNRLYAAMLSVLSNRVVTDTASGMRVIKRSALPHLYPLPDGLHFTPAMSARVLMDENLALVEVPMPYEERIGESKLRVGRDGVRFLRIILEMSLMWRPARLFLTASLAALGLTCLLAMHPVETWFRVGRLREDMIYRLLTCAFLGSLGVSLLSAGVISANLDRLWRGARSAGTLGGALLDAAYSGWGALVAAATATPMLLWLVGRGLWTRVTDGYVDLHWSRVVLAGLLAFAVVQMIVTVMIANVIRFHARRGTARQPITNALRTSSRPSEADREALTPSRDRPLAPVNA